MEQNFATVQDTAELRPVAGGIDEPIPRVTAHELGHALGLSHRQDRTNLLASGTTGTLLNTAEVAMARRKARTLPGTETVASAAEKRERAEAQDRQGRITPAPDLAVRNSRRAEQGSASREAAQS